ncbi:hypothetical protein HN588_16640 [Candidatus Bathyarchaeota archaeon]|jgi:hypothetical protein|nr:hypothetical protein [Candidatus Bathyarchaeota archaeon]
MKTMKMGVAGLSLLAVLLISGCSTSIGHVGHSINTEVQLNQKNFKVIKSVTGEASASYILGFLGGPSKQNLFDQARRDMIKKAELVGTSNAVINITTDIQVNWNLIKVKKTAYVSAEVIQFNK